MTFTAAQIAALIQGRVEGDPDAPVGGFGKIEEAIPGQLAFLANPKYEEYLYRTRASVVIVDEKLQLKGHVAATLIRVAEPYTAFAGLLTQYQTLMQQQLTGRQEPHYLDPTAEIGNDVFIGAFAYVGRQAVIGNGVKLYPQVYVGDNVVIGEGSVLYPGVKVYQGCRIGRNVVLHAGTVIGSDGFGFAPQSDGSYRKVPQIGIVVIEDDVEIGANTTIDRATMGQTTIRRGAKLDNLVQIAHNADIGSSTVIAAQAGISGSTKVGAGVMIGGQAGIVGHIEIGDGARINAQSGVTKSLEPGKAVTGTPAYDYTAALRGQAVARHLPELEKRIKALEALVAELRAREMAG